MKAESWARFAEAIKFYEGQGFRYKDLEWVTLPEFSNITKPTWTDDIYLGNTDCVLLSSAEQAFLQEYDKLDNGLYYAITPCFRDEEELTKLTRPYFVKLELFSKDTSKLNYMINCERTFFLLQIPLPNEGVSTIELQDESYDIEYKNIELGSYLTHKHKDMKWACGTGLSEPRFTQVLEK